MVHFFAVVSGLAALLCTIALISVDLVLAVQARPMPQVKAAATASAVLEVLLWAIIASGLASLFSKSAPTLLTNWSTRRRNIKLGVCVLLIIAGSAASLANVICTSGVSDKHNGNALNGSKRIFVLTLSVFTAMSIVFQSVFVTLYFLILRRLSVDDDSSLHSEEFSSKFSPRWRVKAVPYAQTRPTKSEKLETISFESTEFSTISRPPSAAIVSPRSSISQTIHTVSSKTRLMPTAREMRRSPSVESTRSRRWEADDHSDAGDGTSLELSRNSKSLKRDNSVSAYGLPRSLATIPASPTVNDTPVFGAPGDLELPPPIHRGRSDSNGSMRGSISRADSPSGLSFESAELHIHPLFRSDSPTPPPLASPGTSVFSAPNAGMVLPRRASNQSLKRMRSSSLISISSPLAQSNIVDEQQSIREVDEEPELAPPIPKFVLNAGAK